MVQCEEYLKRAESLKDAMKGQQHGDSGGGAGGGASATATGARTKGKEVWMMDVLINKIESI